MLYIIGINFKLNLAKTFVDLPPARTEFGNVEAMVILQQSMLRNLTRQSGHNDLNIRSVWDAILEFGHTLDSMKSIVESLDIY